MVVFSNRRSEARNRSLGRIKSCVPGIPAFGQYGIATIALGEAASSCDAAVQVGNQIVAAVDLDGGGVELLRLTHGGLLDNSSNDLVSPFGLDGAGYITTTEAIADPVLAVRPDGSILLAGSNGNGGFALLQYQPDGQGLDTTFGTSGVATGPFGQPKGMALLPSGRIVVAGIDSSGSSDQWALAGFEADGGADTSFNGSGGEVLPGISGDPAAVALTADGEIVVAGSSGGNSTLACFTAGGLGVQVSDGTTTFDSSSVTCPTVNLGQTATLAPVAFSDTDPNAWHTGSVDWDDGTVDDATIDETPGDANTPDTGTLTDSHAYSVAGTYAGAVTLTDDSGASITEQFTVTVLAATVALSDFAPSTGGTALDVSYTITDSVDYEAAPFTIGIYTSTDGSTPDSLLWSYTVSNSADLTASAAGQSHTVAITPGTLAGVSGNYSLLAVADGDANPASFDGGIFQATQSQQTTVYVFATGTSDSVSVGSQSIQFDQQSYTLGSSVTSIEVRTAAPAIA